MAGDRPKMVHLGPKMAKHGRLVNVRKWSKIQGWDFEEKKSWDPGILLGPAIEVDLGNR